MGYLTHLFGSSNTVDVIELFLMNQDEYMNLSDIADRLKKTPGSIVHVIPYLVGNGVLLSVPVSKSRAVYRLNKGNQLVKHLLDFNKKVLEDLDSEAIKSLTVVKHEA